MKEESIRIILKYLNNKLLVMSKAERDKIQFILDNEDVCLRELIDWYENYVNKTC